MVDDYPGFAVHNRGTPQNMNDSATDPVDDPTTATTPDTGPGTALPDEEVDQDSEPTITAPPGERPDAGASSGSTADADDADAADADGRA